MTATDELRRLLDDRGVEYTVVPEDAYSREHIKIGSAEIWTNGRGEIAVYHLTPAQAVEATLGSEAEVQNTWLKETYGYLSGMFEAEVAENAKLRELVRSMHDELVSCEDNGYVCGGHKFDERVRELGIEVDA